MSEPQLNPADDNQAPSFEEAIERLEAIIDGIESGEVGLERSLAQYERGMKLIRHCRGILDRAEQRIDKLSVGEDGGLADDPRDAGGAPADDDADPISHDDAPDGAADTSPADPPPDP